MNPESFLSEKAIQRRARYNIPFNKTDLPVSEHYVQQIVDGGYKIIGKSRWLNAVVVEASEHTITELREYSFIRKYQPVKKYRSTFDVLPGKSGASRSFFDSAYYGASYSQVNMLKGDSLHNAGYRGEGMSIAVFDAGFPGVDTMPAFDSLNAENRLLGTRNFVDGNDSVFNSHWHGTAVLSTMASLWPDSLIGTAPKAGYYLFITEDAGSESVLEEYNWVAAAEYADSLGVDVINSSLGYTQFDDSTTSYTYDDMDGNTTLITIGADMAASKGILVVNSAGNSGLSSWKYIGAPADGDSVLTVGAVRADRTLAGFSSRGPSADGRIKPNVCAQGAKSAVTIGDTVRYMGGTSFASPILAGMAACLWQAYPELTNMDIFKSIEQSAHLYEMPNDSLGHGIPDFAKAYKIAGSIKDSISSLGEYVTVPDIGIYPNPFTNEIHIEIQKHGPVPESIVLYDALGQVVNVKRSGNETGNQNITLAGLSHLPKGVYLLQIVLKDQTYVFKLLR